MNVYDENIFFGPKKAYWGPLINSWGPSEHMQCFCQLRAEPYEKDCQFS